MANFDSKIKSLTGIDITDATIQGYITDWLTEGAREVISSMPLPFLWAVASETAIVANTGLDVGTGKLLAVVGDTNELPAREIPASLRYKAKTSGWIEEATSTDPAFYRYDGKVYLLPITIAGKALHVSFPAVLYSESAISNFPDEYEYLVSLYGAVKSLQYLLNQKNADTVIADKFSLNAVSPDSIGTPNFTTPSPALQNATSTISKTLTASAITVEAFNAFNSGITYSDPAPLSLNSVPPDSPSIETIVFTDILSGTTASDNTSFGSILSISEPTITTPTDSLSGGGAVPVYTAPTISDGATSNVLDMNVGTSGDATDQTQPETWWEILGDMIEDDEDVELASVQVSKIATYLQAYNSALQDKLNSFNEDVVEYNFNTQKAVSDANANLQARLTEDNNKLQRILQKSRQDVTDADRQIQKELQNSTANMQAAVSNNQSKISKFQAELQSYQIEVASEVQEYQQGLAEYQLELTSHMQTWTQQQGHNLTKTVTEYQAAIQRDMAVLASQVQVDVALMNKSTDVDLQAKSLVLQKEMQEYQSKMTKYQADLQDYQANASSEIQEYSQKIAAITTDYGWLNDQYNKVKGDYERGMSIMMGGRLEEEKSDNKQGYARA